MKNLFSHLKPCRCRSSSLAGMFLYASTMSGFAKMQLIPQLATEYPKFFAEDIKIFSKAKVSTLSFRLLPSGSETFIHILVFSFAVLLG